MKKTISFQNKLLCYSMKNIEDIAKVISEYSLAQNELRLGNEQLKLLNATLQLAEEKTAILNSIIASSYDAIVSKNLNGIITSWNDAAQRIFGYSAVEMIGQPILKIIPEDRLEEETEILSKLKNGIQVNHFETKRLRKDGVLIDVSLTISPIKDHTGKIIGLSKIARDITDQKLAEETKNEFFGFLSHELKTPLTSISSYVQVLLRKALKSNDEFSAKALIRAEGQTKKMSRMITDFLTVPRLENGDMRLEAEKFNIVELIEETILDAQIISSKNKIWYRGEEIAYVYADQEKISLVLSNMVSNAQKYSLSDGDILVSCGLVNSQYIISVKDNGIGISATNQKRLFEKYYRIKNEETKFIKGFGIGLYLISKIIQLHQSEITVMSEEGVGSTFSFSLQKVG